MTVSLSDESYVAAVRVATAAGETDSVGGVPPAVLVDRLPQSKSAVKANLDRLAEEGELVEVAGISKQVGPRKSYLCPADAERQSRNSQ